jgi:hypothetical protein
VAGRRRQNELCFIVPSEEIFRIFAAVLSIEEKLFNDFIISCSYISTIKIAASNIKNIPQSLLAPIPIYPFLKTLPNLRLVCFSEAGT